MKVKQEGEAFNPITITLETKQDAQALFGLVDKVERFRCNSGTKLELNSWETELIVSLSNLRTEMKVMI